MSSTINKMISIRSLDDLKTFQGKLVVFQTNSTYINDLAFPINEKRFAFVSLSNMPYITGDVSDLYRILRKGEVHQYCPLTNKNLKKRTISMKLATTAEKNLINKMWLSGEIETRMDEKSMSWYLEGF